MNSKEKSIWSLFFLFAIILVPFPTYALGGSEEFWAPIFSGIIVLGFCLLAIIPGIFFAFNRGKSRFWNIVTNILCWIGILIAFITAYNIFPESVTIMMITFILSSLPFGWILKKSIKAGWEYHY